MPKRRERLLLVEDDSECAEAIVDTLALEGYQTVAVPDGLEALSFLERALTALPNLILLDLCLPVMGGRQFLAEQRQRPQLARVPVVLVSGDRDLPQIAAELRADGFLQKPLSPELLLSTVGRVCDGARA